MIQLLNKIDKNIIFIIIKIIINIIFLIQYLNIYISNFRSGKSTKYDGNSWILTDSSKAIEDLYEKTQKK